MIFKLVLLIALLSLATAVMIRRFMGKDVDLSQHKAQIPLQDFLSQLLPIKTSSSSTKSPHMKGETFHIPKEVASSKALELHAEYLIYSGLLVMGKYSPLWLKRHQAIVNFDRIFLPFALIITIFAILARSFAPHIAFTFLLGSLFINCLNNYYLTWIRHNAVTLAFMHYQKLPLHTRQEDQKRFITALQSLKFACIIPKPLQWLK